jgi:hypothetical protein
MDVNPYIEPTSGSVISNQENGTIAWKHLKLVNQ